MILVFKIICRTDPERSSKDLMDFIPRNLMRTKIEDFIKIDEVFCCDEFHSSF